MSSLPCPELNQSFSDGYSTPNDYRHLPHFLPSSPGDDETDEGGYLDYVLSDEDLAEYVDDDDDDMLSVGEDTTTTAVTPSGPVVPLLKPEPSGEDADNEESGDEGYVADDGGDASAMKSTKSLLDALLPSPSASPRRLRQPHRRQRSELSEPMLDDSGNARPRRHSRKRAETLPAGNLMRYIRSWGSNAKIQEPPSAASMANMAMPMVDGYASSSDEQQRLYEDDDDDDVDSWSDSQPDASVVRWAADHLDWETLPVIPDRFLSETTTSPYLDCSLLPEGSLIQRDGQRFAEEQGLFLQAVLQLLAERDQVGVEGSIHSGDNIWKKGPLKLWTKRPGTASLRWKVKYVELRQGNLTYYDDSGSGRMTIHLRQADTVVSEQPSSKSDHYIFDLAVAGSPPRSWMASSEEERSSWIRAIQSAMIGDEAPRRELDLGPHQEALSVYQRIRTAISEADSRELYLEAIRSASPEEDFTLQLPVEWVRTQIKRNDDNEDDQRQLTQRPTSSRTTTAHRQLKSSISDFWKRMSETSFAINGATVPRTSPLSSQRVIGAVARSILEYDRAFTGDGQMTELQAVSYARNILLAALRSKEQEDAWATVQHLLRNDEVVVLSKRNDEEFFVNIEVSFPGEELPEDMLAPISDDMAGWLWIRRPKQPAKTTKKRYAVLSGSVLSYYEEASPRPIGLRGQLIISANSVLKQLKQEELDGESYHVLSVSTPQGQERILLFDQEEDFNEWKESIQASIDSCAETLAEKAAEAVMSDHVVATPENRPKKSIRKSAERVAERVTERVIKTADGIIKGADEGIRGGIRVIKGAKDGSIKVVKTATDGSIKVLRGAVGRLRPSTRSSSWSDDNGSKSGRLQRRPSMQMLLNNTALSGKRDEPSVQCVFQATHSFWISARDDLAVEQVRLVLVNAKVYQAFLLLGGPSGRIARGDALIELDFAEAEESEICKLL